MGARVGRPECKPNEIYSPSLLNKKSKDKYRAKTQLTSKEEAAIHNQYKLLSTREEYDEIDVARGCFQAVGMGSESAVHLAIWAGQKGMSLSEFEFQELIRSTASEAIHCLPAERSKFIFKTMLSDDEHITRHDLTRWARHAVWQAQRPNSRVEEIVKAIVKVTGEVIDLETFTTHYDFIMGQLYKYQNTADLLI
eukprot:Sspe_Gene.81035::Locus_51580_Transcript_1_1_Confidence_1.000_Length_941::g.81035::m.81035